MNQKLRHLHAGKRYKVFDKMTLGPFMLSWILIWFLCVPSSFFVHPFWLLPVMLLLRWVLLIALFIKAAKRLGDQYEAWKTPFLDFIFPFYYLVTGLRALVVKNIRWKD
jgi:hypothetical protein